MLADGRVAVGSVSGGAIVADPSAADAAAGWEPRRYPGSDDAVEVVVPWDQVTTWRVGCVCGWSGGEQPAVTDPLDGSRDCPDDLADRVFRPQWQAHVAPTVALVDLEHLIGQLHTVQARIDDTVRLAHTGGASWAQIGRAAGLSKQGAQQRWATI